MYSQYWNYRSQSKSELDQARMLSMIWSCGVGSLPTSFLETLNRANMQEDWRDL
jgi:hypothetical protein